MLMCAAKLPLMHWLAVLCAEVTTMDCHVTLQDRCMHYRYH